MVDERIKKTADLLVNYSTGVRRKDRVQIVCEYEAKDLALEVYRLVLKKGAYPVVHLGLPKASYVYYRYASDAQLRHFPEIAMYEMKKTDVVIYLASPRNTRELSNISPKKISTRAKVIEPITKERLKKRWVIFDFPTDALAQEADMSLEEFEDFVFNATLVDWRKMSIRMQKLAKLLNRSDEVRIIGEDTDISMSIKGRKAIVADGKYNVPDGEVFTAPVENSVNGYISYEFPAIYAGREVDGIRLEFKNGKCIKASAKKNEKFLKQILKTDKGSRYLGEFGIGCNYNIKRFVKNILFDEKQGKTIHLALGNAYEECRGKNKSAIHWDMIKDMRKGGKIIVDGKLIQRNGKFLI